MFLFVILLCSVLQPILHYYCVFGKRESLQRFVVEDGAKPAIFGSYSYDPVRQVFVPPPPDSNSDKNTSKDLLDHKTDLLDHKTDLLDHKTDLKGDPKTDPDTNQKKDPQAHLTTNTQSHIQTDTHGNELPPHTPSVTISSQSRKDSFISTAGDTGTDDPNGGKKILRKNVAPINSRPWWVRPKTTFENVTFNVV